VQETITSFKHVQQQTKKSWQENQHVKVRQSEKTMKKENLGNSQYQWKIEKSRNYYPYK